VLRGFKCSIYDEMDGREDEEEVWNVDREHNASCEL
jgi:hypothetical protein